MDSIRKKNKRQQQYKRCAPFFIDTTKPEINIVLLGGERETTGTHNNQWECEKDQDQCVDLSSVFFFVFFHRFLAVGQPACLSLRFFCWMT